MKLQIKFTHVMYWGTFQGARYCWNRILRQDGLLRICVPNFQAVVKQYQHTGNLSELQGVLYGGQRDQLDYHKMTFDFSLLQCFLEDAGFNNVRH